MSDQSSVEEQGAAKNGGHPSTMKPKKWKLWVRVLAGVGVAAALICLALGGIASAIFYLLAAALAWSSTWLSTVAPDARLPGVMPRLIAAWIMTAIASVSLPKGHIPEVQKATSGKAEIAEATCDKGALATNVDYAAGDYVRVLTLPQKGSLPVQQQIGEQTAPLTMEEGETIREHCRVGQWSNVHVPASDNVPQLSGWVPSSALEKVPTTKDGRRLYTPSDFQWPQGSASQKAPVIKIINRIMDERRECEAISQRHLVYDKAAKTFSVPCHAGPEMISFSFGAADAANGRSFAKVDPLAKADAIAACRGAVRQNATHPSTLEFPWTGYDFREGQEGRTDLRMSATAKNAFGLELKFKVWCEFHGSELKNFAMEEYAR